ncbi:MAG: hypothetical protein PUF49_10140 [Firmicutes bacterium]|nr:hypothetical protein [Bacillota bacterium]
MRILIMNLVYFLAIIGIGYALFIKNADSMWLYVLTVVFIVGYLLIVRPCTKRHVRDVRKAILENTTFHELRDVKYSPKEGVQLQQIINSGLINDEHPKSFISRQHIVGTMDGIAVEMADVSFPIHEKGMNNFFSGLYLHLYQPGAACSPLNIREGNLNKLEGIQQQQKKILTDLCSFIPGNCYLHMEGEQADLLLRGRFIDYRINPLLEIVEKTLTTDPIPEVKQVIKLFVLRQNKQ